jgi:methionine-rich copper-binding protein CopC
MLKRLGLVLLTVGLLSLAAETQLASAHSRPIRFDPAPGTVLASAPSQVSGWFTAALRNDPDWTFLRVTDAQGNRVDTGSIALSSDRRVMSIQLRGGLGDGRYLVTWRGYDDEDGAIFGDCYTFFVGQAAADAAVADRTRLDGGSSCERADIEARAGTPTPGSSLILSEEHTDEENESDEGNDVPLWSLIAGIGVGAAVGMVAGRFLTGNR